MERRVFDRIRGIVYDKSGISLSDQKDALVSARVAKRMRALGIREHKSYLSHLLADESGEELVHLLDAISTNVTNFFREGLHFEFLTDVFTEWLSQGQRRFRFWSAACSTGQEPYTLAMVLLEAMRKAGVEDARADTRILATDISTQVLAHSMNGCYAEEKMEHVPRALRARYFDREKHGGAVQYTARTVMKKMILFRRLNLSRPPFPMRGPMDAIFCRNVMIYFDNKVRRNLLGEMFRLLRPDGYLMVGHAESLTGMVSDFQVVRSSIYAKPMATRVR